MTEADCPVVVQPLSELNQRMNWFEEVGVIIPNMQTGC